LLDSTKIFTANAAHMKNIHVNFHCKHQALKKLLHFKQKLVAHNYFERSVVA